MSDKKHSASPPKHSPDSGTEPRKNRVLAVCTLTAVIAAVVVTLATIRTKPTKTDTGREKNRASGLQRPVAADAGTQHSLGSPTLHSDIDLSPYHTNSDEFVGSQTCAECHPEIARKYATHPMANTLEAVADAEISEIADGDRIEFEALGCRYRVERVGNQMTHTEFMTDDAGKLIYELSLNVDYAMGSGMNARTYLVDHGGIMVESPITWYTEKGIWDLSPGYRDNPKRFNRRITDDCVQCHSGRSVPVGDGNSARFAKQPFVEPGIGCENCHGPGRQHVDSYMSGDGDEDHPLIVNPANLERRAEDSVCYQCHMEGKRRVLRKGKSYHDFRPGMTTEDIWTVFVSTTPFESDGTARFTSHVEQMEASTCFKESEGRMRCTTCHDPHYAPAAEERAAFYRNRCNSCHSEHGCALPASEREAPPALDSCIHCHMPVIGSSDIPHTSLSDHRVLRNPNDSNSDDDVPKHLGTWSIFGGSENRMPSWERKRALAIAKCDQAILDTNLKLMNRAVANLEAAQTHDPRDVEITRRLGFVYGAMKDHNSALGAFQSAVRANASDEKSLKNLGLIAMRTGSPQLALESYKAYLKLNSFDGSAYGPYAALLAQSGAMEDAVTAAERGLELDPTQIELRGLAAQLYARLGNRGKSVEHQTILKKIALRLEPFNKIRQQRYQKKRESNL